MYKTIAVYSHIQDLNEFEAFYTNEVVPRILGLEEVKHIRFTTLIPTDQVVSQSEEISVLIETYYHSAAALRSVLDSEESKEITKYFLYIQESGMARIESFLGSELVLDSF
ncbi:hypothetical protein [Thermoactinomyces sp. DSM 45892]|uniref:hypothetical protein n=1 Tax=Thermoactinomyces sp. DSM 45892 TaxID=1882753 RepID=UPI00089959CE|nr:hypothetical protein [Thermoactinomyces sp. DSM 45892]SDZ38455.1 hypothetical protein SAMN05444416_1364 [Thermoactinomyces sp. DSM 45892]